MRQLPAEARGLRRIAPRVLFLLITPYLLLGCGRAESHLSSAASSASVLAPPSPTVPSAAAPDARDLPTVVYDGVSRQLLLFGGTQASGQYQSLGDTWTRGDNGWSLSVVQSAPTARAGALAVYDPVHANVLLFGGQTSSHQLLSDTWIWNGSSWAVQKPNNSPHGLFPKAGNLTFDSARGEAILFGNTGIGTGTTQGPPTFTWGWTGSDWVQKNTITSPPFRFAAAMAYDGASKNLVLFGGYQCESAPSCKLGDTWLWDGSAWKEAASTSPSLPTAGPAYAAYDEKANRLWLLTIDGAMWLWSGSSWLQQGAYPAFANRLDGAMVFDGAIGKMVFYGGMVAAPSGNTMKTDLWAWDGITWSQIG